MTLRIVRGFTLIVDDDVNLSILILKPSNFPL